jgi:addiction module HigA family antidote
MLSMHPGEYIKAVYVEGGGLSISDLAEKLDVSVSTISRIINQKSDVTPNMAMRLAYVLDRSAESWLSMQTSFSLSREKKAFSADNLKKAC